jgi:hypothetical protein
MGTSTSSRGPNNSSPLVPPWADVDGRGTGPTPPPNRFQGFRTALGKFVRTGNQSYMRSALRSYASTSTGGSAVGARRFGAMVQAGGGLYEALDQLRRDPANAPVDLQRLVGKSTREVIDALVDWLVPENGDADRIRTALNDSLSECLDGADEFDFGSLTDDVLMDIMITYVSNCVFEQIMLDSNRAFAKAQTPEQAETAEHALSELVTVVTEKHMTPLIEREIRTMSNADMQAAQIAAIKDVWREWEDYQP